MKYQNYKHYKLPITMNAIEYGKLIFQSGNLFIVQINKTNIALIKQHEEINHVKLFHKGDFVFEYKDFKAGDNIFIRSLNNKKFKFEQNKLTFISVPVRNNQINSINNLDDI
jgi:hypothetical protein